MLFEERVQFRVGDRTGHGNHVLMFARSGQHVKFRDTYEIEADFIFLRQHLKFGDIRASTARRKIDAVDRMAAAQRLGDGVVTEDYLFHPVPPVRLTDCYQFDRTALASIGSEILSGTCFPPSTTLTNADASAG